MHSQNSQIQYSHIVSIAIRQCRWRRAIVSRATVSTTIVSRAIVSRTIVDDSQYSLVSNSHSVHISIVSTTIEVSIAIVTIAIVSVEPRPVQS